MDDVVQTVAPPATDLPALKARQQAAWSSGDYAVVGTTLQSVGEDLCEALDIRAGSVPRLNQADDGTMVMPSEYLEVVISRR